MRETKSISAETTFVTDIADRTELERQLWRLTEKLANRLHGEDFAAGGVVLKLKTAAFVPRTRTHRLDAPTRLPDLLFAAARTMLAHEVDGTAFRLIGIGARALHVGSLHAYVYWFLIGAVLLWAYAAGVF